MRKYDDAYEKPANLHLRLNRNVTLYDFLRHHVALDRHNPDTFCFSATTMLVVA